MYIKVSRGRGRSWRSFCLIFSPSFFILFFYRYFSISEGVLGRFWEAKVIEKSRFGMFFGPCFWRPPFRTIFVGFLRNLMTKSTWNFDCFPICCFSICLLNWLLSLMLEPFKTSIFLCENTYFGKISCCAFDVPRG